MKEFHDVFA
jgi:hypothetical protein